MGESNTVVSAYALHRHLQQYCSHPSNYILQVRMRRSSDRKLSTSLALIREVPEVQLDMLATLKKEPRRGQHQHFQTLYSL